MHVPQEKLTRNYIICFKIYTVSLQASNFNKLCIKVYSIYGTFCYTSTCVCLYAGNLNRDNFRTVILVFNKKFKKKENISLIYLVS